MVDDDTSGRRLPLWMLGVAAADERVMPQASHSEGKTETVTKGPNGTSGVKCETKRKRKSCQRDANCDGIITATLSGKKMCNGRQRKRQESTATKRQKAKAEDFDDDDVDLTMEDLMAIAEEYVKVKKNMERQESIRDCGSERQVLMTVSSSSNNSRCLLDVPNNDQSSSAHELTVDPAQDMLDLFLGPLLKKPQMEGNKSFVKDIAFAYEFERQTQNNVVGEEIEPLMKKKSSLKDKVAMFLD